MLYISGVLVVQLWTRFMDYGYWNKGHSSMNYITLFNNNYLPIKTITINSIMDTQMIKYHTVYILRVPMLNNLFITIPLLFYVLKFIGYIILLLIMYTSICTTYYLPLAYTPRYFYISNIVPKCAIS